MFESFTELYTGDPPRFRAGLYPSVQHEPSDSSWMGYDCRRRLYALYLTQLPRTSELHHWKTWGLLLDALQSRLGDAEPRRPARGFRPVFLQCRPTVPGTEPLQANHRSGPVREGVPAERSDPLALAVRPESRPSGCCTPTTG